MLTYEKVFAAFSDYLEADNICEVIRTSRGYTVMDWEDTRKEWVNVRFCPSPEALRDALLSNYMEYLTFLVTDGYERDETEQEEQNIREKCDALLRQLQDTET